MTEECSLAEILLNLDLEHDFVPGGGFPADLDEDDLVEEDELEPVAGPSTHLRNGHTGGGGSTDDGDKSMAELQRITMFSGQ